MIRGNRVPKDYTVLFYIKGCGLGSMSRVPMGQMQGSNFSALGGRGENGLESVVREFFGIITVSFSHKK